MGTMTIEASQRRTAGAVSEERRLPVVTRANGCPGKAGVVLWIVQGLLALVFLAAGGMKLAMPLEMLAAASPLPPLFLKFIGTCEVLGALGLILPGLLRIRPGLTPLAAAGLVLIMIGATIVTVATMDVGSALVPLVVGLLAASVAYGRRRVAPRIGPSRRPGHRAVSYARHHGMAGI